MTKKVSMRAYFTGLSNERIREYFASDGFDVEVAHQKNHGVWIKFKDKVDASMFILQYDTMAKYIVQLEDRYPLFQARPYQQALTRGIRKGELSMVAAGRRNGKSLLTQQYIESLK